MTQEVWYRYYYSSSEDRVRVLLEEFQVLRQTQKGVWIALYPGHTGKFVLRDATKRYACPTKEEALTSFIARKTKQLRIMRACIRDVECAVKLAKEGKTIGSITDFEFDISTGDSNAL